MNAPARPLAITPRAETDTAALASPELLEPVEFVDEPEDPELELPDEPELEVGFEPAAEPVPLALVPAELLAGAALARFATLVHLAAAFALVSFWLYGR